MKHNEQKLDKAQLLTFLDINTFCCMISQRKFIMLQANFFSLIFLIAVWNGFLKTAWLHNFSICVIPVKICFWSAAKKPKKNGLLFFFYISVPFSIFLSNIYLYFFRFVLGQSQLSCWVLTEYIQKCCACKTEDQSPAWNPLRKAAVLFLTPACKLW